MVVGAGVWIFAGIISLLLVGLTIWVTNKAYSKKWDQ